VYNDVRSSADSKVAHFFVVAHFLDAGAWDTQSAQANEKKN
jgi:hypothetical protein